jgi:F420-non-reducing hydrogenase iron-sulfur subunit
VGFVCDWAVATADIADTSGRLRQHPSVALIRVPCSGFIRPSWLEDTLKAGADGVFVVGCPYGDCLNREGNFLMQERIETLQRRLQRRKIEPERLTMMAHGLHDGEAFVAEVGRLLETLGRIAAAPAAAPAAARAPVAPRPAAPAPTPAAASPEENPA